MKRLLKLIGIILLFIVIAVDAMFLFELRKADGNPIKAAVRCFKKCCRNCNKLRAYICLIIRAK